MMRDYNALLARKRRTVEDAGVAACDPHPMLFPFQLDLVQWAARKGRAAIFADCGLGKTLMQLEWARAMPGPCLIVAPLAVASQTIAEAERVGLRVIEVADPTDDAIQITNYEKLGRFDPAHYMAVVLDESSILKSVDGKTRTRLIREWARVPYRLCCTATPAPNDIAEMANHAEFLGAMSRAEMLATFFVHDDEGWRLKGHGRAAFWRWVASWATFLRRPSDLGHEDDGFDLPPLRVGDDVVAADYRPSGSLFADTAKGIGGRLEARRATIGERVARAADIIRSRPGPWLVWCGLNDEADAIEAVLGDEAVQVAGKDAEADKIARERAWRTGERRVLITKPRIFGFGMNWQHCRQMIFLGIGDSYEQYYQSVRRCWRFGQSEAVDAMIVIGNAEAAVAANVRRKEADAARLADGVIAAMRDEQIREVRGMTKPVNEYRQDAADGDGWRLLLGDCVERMREVPDGSVGLSVFSPPFATLYTYSASERDMGNCKDHGEFFEHFAHLIPELLRVTMPGRRAAVHVQQVSTTMAMHGVIGWVDFRAEVVRRFVAAGWIYDGEVVIDKDPQAQAIRTHSKALLFVQKERDSSWLRPAMADYIVLFRAPGENPEPVKCDVSNEEWIAWARPIWYGIRESDTLNAAEARDAKDERHICPLQLETIERCVRLWTNAGDTVLDPFAGIGSTGVVALQQERHFVGIELKESYWRCARKNLLLAKKQLALFTAEGK